MLQQLWECFRVNDDCEPCIDREYFLLVMVRCQQLDSDVLQRILNYAEYESGYLTQYGFSKALALLSLAKQCKDATDKALQQIPQTSWPIPDFGDLSKLRTVCVQVQRDRNPGHLGLTYQDLCELDSISLRLCAEKKGVMPLMGHYEYEVSSVRFNAIVLRRYNDFLALNELLLARFPYRLVPPFPAKRIIKDNNFMAERLHSLRTFLMHVSRHPVLCDEPILQHFFTCKKKDYASSAREEFRNLLDEYLTHQHGEEAAKFVSCNFASEHQSAQEFLENLKNTLIRFKEAAARVQMATLHQAEDFHRVHDSLIRMSTMSSLSGSLAGPSFKWEKFQALLPSVATELGAAARAIEDHAASEQEGFVDQLDQICVLLQGYSNLIKRCSSVKEDHKRSQGKLTSHIRSVHASRIQGDSQPKLSRLESRIDKERQCLDSLEKRSHFVNFCLQLETQLIHSNLEALFSCIDMMCNVERLGHQQILSAWQRLKYRVETMLPNCTNRTSTCLQNNNGTTAASLKSSLTRIADSSASH